MKALYRDFNKEHVAGVDINAGNTFVADQNIFMIALITLLREHDLMPAILIW